MDRFINGILNFCLLGFLFFLALKLFYFVIPEETLPTVPDWKIFVLLLIEVAAAVLVFIKLYKWINSLKWYQKL